MVDHFEAMAQTMDYIAAQTNDPETAKALLHAGSMPDSYALACMIAQRSFAATLATLANHLIDIETTTAEVLEQHGIQVVHPEQVRHHLQEYLAGSVRAAQEAVQPAIAQQDYWWLSQHPAPSPADADASEHPNIRL